MDDKFYKNNYQLEMAQKKCNALSPFACGPRSAETSPKIKNSKDLEHRSRPPRKGYWPVTETPLRFQVDAVKFAIARLKNNKPVYLALDPGLGKTICAAIVYNFFNAKGSTKAYYVCPPFLTSNTDSEFTKWCADKKLYLLPDSMIAKQKTLDALQEDIDCWRGDKILFIDEAHRFKNEHSKRSRALLKKILPHFKKVVWLSGTPIPNGRPVEIWPILRASAPEIFGREFFPYGLKYCGGYANDFGWDFSGFTNRNEWKARIQRTFMLRMKKGQVLKLPPKTESLLTVGEGLTAALSNLEHKILNQIGPDVYEGKIAKQHGKDELHISTYLRLLGEHKVKHCLPYIENLLEDTKENILLFCVHKETLAKLRYALQDYEPLVIDGATPKARRQELVNLYQTDPKHRLMILNITAGGVGYTLTKASRVIFVEFTWVDGDNSQASDRAHRIGQQFEVLVQYVVLKGSIDRKRMEVLLNKRRLSI